MKVIGRFHSFLDPSRGRPSPGPCDAHANDLRGNVQRAGIGPALTATDLNSTKPEMFLAIGDHPINGDPRAEDMLRAQTALARHRGDFSLPSRVLCECIVHGDAESRA
jgi:hypothetical protein